MAAVARLPVGKIRRGHNGCKACRRRGKLCDEAKPVCRACHRLSLACEYGLDISFRHYDAHQLQALHRTKTSTSRSAEASETVQRKSPNSRYRTSLARTRPDAVPLAPPLVEQDTAGIYFRHFESHVRHVLPGAFKAFLGPPSASAPLHYALLCISASNLAMLDSGVQSRLISGDHTRSCFSPRANRVHHDQARAYHDLAIAYCDSEKIDDGPNDCAPALVAKALLAVYHHASTDHQRFRSAVEEVDKLVHQYGPAMLQSPDGHKALHMWHRLSASSRTSRRPALLLQGEGDECSGTKCSGPDATEHLRLTCILGMSPDDLIYDILIKTIELRKRAVVFRTVAGIYNVSDQSRDLGRLAHEHLDSMFKRRGGTEEYEEAEVGFVRGPHLLGLIQLQQERLSVWKSRIDTAQPPPGTWDFQSWSDDGTSPTACGDLPTFTTHRDAMNALYYLLCRVMVAVLQGDDPLQDSPEPSCQSGIPCAAKMVRMMLRILDTLDYSTSNTSDVYTFSVGEVLLQLALVWHSASTFRHILDVIWPRLEAGGRGFEHSHCPTHLAKRIVALIADQWARGRHITYASLAVEESTPKLRLLAIDPPVDVVMGGHRVDGACFMERMRLP